MEMEKIIKKLKNDRYNRKIFSLIPKVYLVGGFIRDVITGRRSRDRDYIVDTDPLLVANDIKKSFGGKVIIFKEESTVRVALLDGSTLDFSRILGDIKSDLNSRDFTINSVAFCPGEGIIDYVNGIVDMGNHVIRTFNRNNLANDPLRCLRAYRMQSELGWSIEFQTRETIKEVGEGLSNISFERITLEFFKLINGEHYLKALNECNDDGILSAIICHNINVLCNNIKKLHEVEELILKLPFKERKIRNTVFSHNLTVAGVIRLEQLLHGCSFDRTKLTYSRQILKRLLKAHRFLNEIQRKGEEIDIFDSFFSANDMIYDLVCLSRNYLLYHEGRKFLDLERNKLLSSEEIMGITEVRGSRFGSIIYHLNRERFYGRVKTKKEAKDFVRNMYFNDE